MNNKLISTILRLLDDVPGVLAGLVVVVGHRDNLAQGKLLRLLIESLDRMS
jgi:hypothetical protein